MTIYGEKAAGAELQRNRGPAYMLSCSCSFSFFNKKIKKIIRTKLLNFRGKALPNANPIFYVDVRKKTLSLVLPRSLLFFFYVNTVKVELLMQCWHSILILDPTVYFESVCVCFLKLWILDPVNSLTAGLQLQPRCRTESSITLTLFFQGKQASCNYIALLLQFAAFSISSVHLPKSNWA